MLKLYRTKNSSDLLDMTDLSSLLIPSNKDEQGSIVKQVFVRNDDVATWLANIVFTLTSDSYEIVDGTNAVGIKLYYSDYEPTDRMWNRVAYGNSETVPSVGAIGTPDIDYHGLWIRVDSASMVDVGIYSATLSADYVENSV